MTVSIITASILKSRISSLSRYTTSGRGEICPYKIKQTGSKAPIVPKHTAQQRYSCFRCFSAWLTISNLARGRHTRRSAHTRRAIMGGRSSPLRNL
jgi:hypothetical protein